MIDEGDLKVIDITRPVSDATSSHLGSHVAGALDPGDQKIGNQGVSLFIGPAAVLDLCADKPGEITAAAIIAALKPFDEAVKHAAEIGRKIDFPRRVLLKTKKISDGNEGKRGHSYLSLDAVEFLYAKGVQLVGIDSDCIDQDAKKHKEARKMLAEYQMHWLERLDLSAVTPGVYFLSALPLKLTEGEDSPVRAVLVTMER